jgi:hypothetical protein
MSHLYNSSGSPVLPWDTTAGPGESALQRTRRRYQERRCLACGTVDRAARSLFCRSCHPAWSYCATCETVKPRDEFWMRSQCKPCQLARQAEYGLTQAEAERRCLAAMQAANRVRSAAIDAQIRPLLDRGWTVAEIARAIGRKPRSVQRRVVRLQRESADA